VKEANFSFFHQNICAFRKEGFARLKGMETKVDNSLKNRYIYAVTRHLPAKMQADVEKELDGLISEMVDERRGNNAPSDQDIKDTLTELGTPEELALKYYGSERRALISGVYFLMYKLVLRTVLPIVAIVVSVLATLGFLIGDETSSNITVGFVNISSLPVVGITITAVIMAFAVITVVFAAFDYMKVDLKDGDIFDLPEVPGRKFRISPSEPIFGIALSIFTTVLFLGFPHIPRIIFSDTGWLPVFDTAVIRGLWLPILLWTLLEITVESLKLIEGRYTMRLAAVTVAASILQVVCAVTIFMGNNILNPEFASHIANYDINFWIFDRVITQPNLIPMAILLAIIFFETLEVVVKAFVAGKN